MKVGPAAVPTLTKSLDDSNHLVRQRAAEILAAIGPASRKAAPSLVEMLKDSRYEVNAAAEKALIAIGEPAVGALAAALKKEEAGIRKLLVQTLGKLGPVAAPALIQGTPVRRQIGRLRGSNSPVVLTHDRAHQMPGHIQK